MRVARLGSARSAASELGLSPSALSRRITQLEEWLDKPLFNRQNQQMTLNEDGRNFHDAVAPALDALIEAVHGQASNSQTMRFRLGVLPLFGSQRLFPRLGELRDHFPGLHIDIDTSGHGESRLGDTLDAAIILSRQPDPALHQVRLDRNFVYAIAARELVEEIGDKPDFDTLSRQTFLIHNEMTESFISWKKALGVEDLQPASVDHFDSGPLMLAAAAQGLGIAIMHDDHLSRSADPRLAHLYNVRVESPYSYWFVCRPRSLESRPVRIFHDWLVKSKL